MCDCNCGRKVVCKKILSRDCFDKNTVQNPFSGLGPLLSPWSYLPLGPPPTNPEVMFNHVDDTIVLSAEGSDAPFTGNLFMYRRTFNIDDTKEHVVRTCLKQEDVVSMYDVDPDRFPLDALYPEGPDYDPRLTGGFGTVTVYFDYQDSTPYYITACFFVTAKSVWAFHDAAYFGPPPAENPRPAWQSGKLVYRGDTGKFREFKSIFDKKNNTIKWFINGELMRTVEDLGFRPAESNLDVVTYTDGIEKDFIGTNALAAATTTEVILSQAGMIGRGDQGLEGPQLSNDGRPLAFPTSSINPTKGPVPQGKNILDKLTLSEEKVNHCC